MKLLSTIPFSGFYNSIHSDQIDYQIQSQFWNDQGELKNPDKFWEHYSPNQWGCYEAYASNFVEYMAKETELPLVFESMTSPREYNFVTDQIFVHVPIEMVEKMFEELPKRKLEAFIIDRFTSRSGFISYYSNDLAEWLEKPLNEWDHNEVGTLLESWLNWKGFADIEQDFIGSYECDDSVTHLIPNEFYEQNEVTE